MLLLSSDFPFLGDRNFFCLDIHFRDFHTIYFEILDALVFVYVRRFDSEDPGIIPSGIHNPAVLILAKHSLYAKAYRGRRWQMAAVIIKRCIDLYVFMRVIIRGGRSPKGG